MNVIHLVGTIFVISLLIAGDVLTGQLSIGFRRKPIMLAENFIRNR
jgi:hypothetical protein